MKNQTITSRSPKNKFRIELTSNKSIAGLGSYFSTGTMNVDSLKDNNFYNHYKNMIVSKGGGHVTVKENLSTYPEFNWVKINSFKI